MKTIETFSMSGFWRLSNRCDDEVRPLADRHYNRQKIGAKGFVPPGRCLVLKSGHPVDAFWVTSFPFAEYVLHEWAGALVCSAFRNESQCLSSQMIIEAVGISRWKWLDQIPEQGMITFVNPKKISNKINPGYCYQKAGFIRVGHTKSGLPAFQMKLCDMPPIVYPNELSRRPQ